MSFLLYLSGLLLIGVVAVFVAAPLLRPGPDWEMAPESEDPTAGWERQKNEAYAVIKEAEFDRQMGKLTDEDYRMLREKHEARALEALTQLDRLGQEGNEQA